MKPPLTTHYPPLTAHQPTTHETKPQYAAANAAIFFVRRQLRILPQGNCLVSASIAH